MRTFIFVVIMILQGTVIFLNMLTIGAAMAKRAKTGARFGALVTNVIFLLGVIYIYNTSIGD